MPLPVASKKAAQIFQNTRCSSADWPAASDSAASRIAMAADGSPVLTTRRTDWSNNVRNLGSYPAGAARTGIAASTQAQSMDHKSAGCTRSPPTRSSTSRYWGNNATEDADLPFRTPSRYSATAKPARSTFTAASSLQSSGRCANFCANASMARNTLAGALNPTISSAPTAWWSCWRAMRNWLASSSASSEPRASSASRTKRRMALVAPASDFFSSSRTQARGPRSLPASSLSPGVAAFVCMDSCTPEMAGTGWRAQAILNRDTDWRNSSAIRDSSRTCDAVDRVPSPVCSVTAKIC